MTTSHELTKIEIAFEICCGDVDSLVIFVIFCMMFWFFTQKLFLKYSRPYSVTQKVTQKRFLLPPFRNYFHLHESSLYNSFYLETSCYIHLTF